MPPQAVGYQPVLTHGRRNGRCHHQATNATVAGAFLVAVTLSVVTGCGSTSNEGAKTSRIRVVATTTQVADFVGEIGGDCIDRYGVLKPNVDPHDYEPSPADLDAIARADVIVSNGVGLEPWLSETVSSAGSHAAVIDTSVGVPIRAGDKTDQHDDPHIWQNPQNAKTMVTNIAHAIENAAPNCKQSVEENLARYSAQLDQLDHANEVTLNAMCSKKIVTNHDSLGYYIDRYGLEFIGAIIPSFDTSTELSAAGIADLVTQLRDQDVKAIFAEASLPAKTADAIGNETKIQIVQGNDALYGDTLGAAGSAGSTYLTMVAHNTKTIAANLSC